MEGLTFLETSILMIIFAHLDNHNDGDTCCFLSLRTIAQIAGIPERTVDRNLHMLQEKGILESTYKSDGDGEKRYKFRVTNTEGFLHFGNNRNVIRLVVNNDRQTTWQDVAPHVEAEVCVEKVHPNGLTVSQMREMERQQELALEEAYERAMAYFAELGDEEE